jgi:hypothetical protein
LCTLGGAYSGNIVTTVSLDTLDISNKASRKVTARITDDNRLFILDGTTTVHSGTILNDGTFELISQFVPASGRGKVRGKRIELEFTSGSLLVTDANGVPIVNTVRNKVVLTRR